MTAAILWSVPAMGLEEDVTNTSFQGYFTSSYSFQETVARLKALSGQDPVLLSDKYKTSVEFQGSIQGHVFTLYDYKCDRELHIGGHSTDVVALLQEALPPLLAGVTPAPYHAKEYYTSKNGKGHHWP